MALGCDPCNSSDLGWSQTVLTSTCQTDDIYCVGGVPRVRRTPIILSGSEARFDLSSGGVDFAFIAGGAVLGAPGVTTTVAYTNTGCFTAHIEWTITANIEVDVTTAQKALWSIRVMDGATILQQDSMFQPVFGGLAGNSRQYLTKTYAGSTQVPVGGSINLYPQLFLQLNVGAPTAGTGHLDANAALRIWGAYL